MTRIQLRRGTAAEWANVNPVLASGEPGVEVDTSKLKVGDGSTAWADLPYVGVAAPSNVFSESEDGLVPAPITATGGYLRDDGTWGDPTMAVDPTLQTIEYLVSSIANRIMVAIQPSSGGYLRVDASPNTVSVNMTTLGGANANAAPEIMHQVAFSTLRSNIITT